MKLRTTQTYKFFIEYHYAKKKKNKRTYEWFSAQTKLSQSKKGSEVLDTGNFPFYFERTFRKGSLC